jgi:hypothetical protein
VGKRERKERTEPLLDALLIVIRSSAGLPSLHESLQHYLFCARKEQDEQRLADLSESSRLSLRTHAILDLEKSTDRLIENGCLVHLAREAIHQEAALAIAPAVFSLTLALF